MEPNANFPGTLPSNSDSNNNDLGRLTPNFSNGSSGEPVGIPPFKSTPPTPAGPVPMPSNFPPSQPSPIPSAPLNPTPPPVPPEPVREIPIPPPPPTPPAAPKESVPGVVNYSLSGTEEGSKISAGVPMNGTPASPASFNIPTPPIPQQAPFAKQGSVTPPPGAGDVVVRTLGSDLEALKKSGGLGAQPSPIPGNAASTIPNVSKTLGAGPAQAGTIPPKGPDAVNPYGFEGGPIFTPQNGPAGTVKKKAVSGKTIEMAVIGLVIIGVLAAVYFLVLPGLFPTPAKNIAAPITVSTTTPVAEQTTPSPFVHHSFLSATSTKTLIVDLPALSLADISSALNFAADPTSTPAKTLAEVQMTYGKDPLQTSQILPTLFPDPSSTLIQYFNNDFTSFLYYDGTFAWPGYIFKLNPAYSSSTEIAVESASASTETSTATAAQTSPTSSSPAITPTETINDMIKSVVESASLSGMYLDNPGTMLSKTWANGSLPNKSLVRYVRFSKAGRVFEYGWFSNYLILSTSYSGIVQAEGTLSGS